MSDRRLMLLLAEIVGGLVALVGGGELLVGGAAGLAGRFGLSPLAIGVIVVGFGTSTPELATSVAAAIDGYPGIAIGNVVGSNIANILLILGVAAVLRPFATSRAAVRRDGLLVLLTALALAATSLLGAIGRLEGAVFVLGLVLYLVWTYRSDRNSGEAIERPEQGRPLILDMLLVAAGLVMLIAGANLFVTGAQSIAERLGVPDTVIGLSLVALGTSLPELTTSIVAALRGHSAMALGNVLGSNVYNVLGIAGLTALVRPIPISPEMRRVDMPIMLAVSVVMLILIATGQRLTRAEGLLLLGLYCCYIALLLIRANHAAAVALAT